MAVWDEESNSLDWDLARIGFVTKYMKAENLASASKELVNLGYRVIAFDAGSWSSEAKMHNDLAAGLHFPGWYGRGLDAFNDCIRDVASLGYGWEPQDTGIVLVFDNYDVFEKAFPRTAFHILDILWEAARYASLLGNRMLCLVRGSDPWWEVPPLGGQSPSWNFSEWRDANRGV
jgi:RNAse (barnase) inhibitor barstar